MHCLKTGVIFIALLISIGSFSSVYDEQWAVVKPGSGSGIMTTETF